MQWLPHSFAATLALSCLLAHMSAAEEPGDLVIGSFGDQPLELSVSADLSGATLIGHHADASLTATLTEGNQGPVILTMTLSGALPDPEDVTLELTFARDMGRTWQGNRDSLTLELSAYAVSEGMITLSGTVTGGVSDGTALETRPVTFSFNARLNQENRS